MEVGSLFSSYRLSRLTRRYIGPPEKVNSESASTQKTFVEHAARSSRRSDLRLQRQSANTLTALIDREKA
jgi:hypothetical protein